MSAIIVVDSRIVYSFDPHDLFELPTYPRLSSGGDEVASNTPMLVELGTSEEVIPYFSESNDSFHEALPVQLQDCIGSSSAASHLSWESTSYKVSASVQTEVAFHLCCFINLAPTHSL